MSLNISVTEKEPGVFIVMLVGRLDMITAPALEREVTGLLARLPKVVIFDMGGVEYISSMGVREVIRTKKALMARGGRFAMVNNQIPVQRVFDIIAALPKEEIFENMEEMDAYLSAMQREALDSED